MVCVTAQMRHRKALSSRQTQAARFGINKCKHLKSNAIALVQNIDENPTLVGAGMGQPNRLSAHKTCSTGAKEAYGIV